MTKSDRRTHNYERALRALDRGIDVTLVMCDEFTSETMPPSDQPGYMLGAAFVDESDDDHDVGPYELTDEDAEKLAAHEKVVDYRTIFTKLLDGLKKSTHRIEIRPTNVVGTYRAHVYWDGDSETRNAFEISHEQMELLKAAGASVAT